ncbi:Protein of unknown function [Gryllus bimaculatus]|nr:Protein of unknown function [Gryllus bimaculatus]
MSSDCSHLCPFASFSAVLGVKQITHLIFCFMLFTVSFISFAFNTNVFTHEFKSVVFSNQNSQKINAKHKLCKYYLNLHLLRFVDKKLMYSFRVNNVKFVQDNVYGIRSWLKSNVIGLCMLFVLGLYCNVLLFVGGSTGLAITCVLMLLLSMSGKIYFGLVVNSHHATLAPDHVWGSAMRVGDSAPRRTCRSVPPLHVQQPTAVLVAA